MKILFIGDVFGKSGRDAVVTHLPRLKSSLNPDIVICNGENAAHGAGITASICKELYEAGVDCITTGNHAFAQREILLTIDKDERLLRPINYPKGTPGGGVCKLTLRDGRVIVIANIMGRVFMEPLDHPFLAADALFNAHKLGKGVNAIFIDFHAEATSEKMAFGHYCDGRASAVIGTHTHIPTADHQVLAGGTAYQTDAGMTGDYDSVIGSKKDIPIQRFVRQVPPMERMSPAEGEATLCGTWVETDDKTGLAARIEGVRVGGRLSQTIPQ